MPIIVRVCRKRIVSNEGQFGGVALLASGNLAAETVTVTEESSTTTIAAPSSQFDRRQEVWEFVVSGGDVWAKAGAAPEASADDGELFLNGERIIRAAEVEGEMWAFAEA